MAKKTKEKLGAKGQLVMSEFKEGRLRSSAGTLVINPSQAQEIAFSEQRREAAGHRPRKRKTSVAHYNTD